MRGQSHSAAVKTNRKVQSILMITETPQWVKDSGTCYRRSESLALARWVAIRRRGLGGCGNDPWASRSARQDYMHTVLQALVIETSRSNYLDERTVQVHDTL